MAHFRISVFVNREAPWVARLGAITCFCLQRNTNGKASLAFSFAAFSEFFENSDGGKDKTGNPALQIK